MIEKKILCIGSGYVGGPSMAVIASKCHDCQITVVDVDEARINSWNSDKLPIYEPCLKEIVKEVRGKNLFFSTDIAKGIRDNDIIFVCVGTPTKRFGIGADVATDLYYWEKTARQILENSQSSKIIIEKSTLPVRTAMAMEKILNSGNSSIHFEILSNPEFMAEGTAINDLLNPDRVLIGSSSTDTGTAAKNMLIDIYAQWISPDHIITSNVWSAELSKLIANALLAQRISSINATSVLCEMTGADVTEVSRAVGMDNRIGSCFLSASIGFGGSCFKKDILSLAYICRAYGLEEVASYWEEIVKINEYQKDRFVLNMLKFMFNSLVEKRICLLGFAFKSNTGDTRESPAITIARRIIAEQAIVIITDPQALTNARIELSDLSENIEYQEDIYEAARGCHAIAIMTEWQIYKDLDYQKIYDSMIKPAFIFDGRNILDHQRCFEIGFNVYPIGKAPLVNL